MRLVVDFTGRHTRSRVVIFKVNLTVIRHLRHLSEPFPRVMLRRGFCSSVSVISRKTSLSRHGGTLHQKEGIRSLTTGEACITEPLHYINGQRVQPANDKQSDDITVLEPATGRTLCTMRSASQQDVSDAVRSAKEAFPQWAGLPGAERSRLLYRAAQIIRENREEIAVAEVRDTGKPIYEARLDIDGCADTVEYCAGLSRVVSGQHIDLGGGSFGYTRREPLGVVGGIGAWNFPFQMTSWKSAGALCCGNTMVYKPSPLTPVTAVMMAEIYRDAGVPPGVFNVVQGEGETGQSLSLHPDIAKMSFTGSVPTGVKVMEACAKNIKYVLLELGGKSPVVIFDDCDLDNAVKGTMMANFLTQGQVCSNGTRVYVQKPIYNKFLEKLVESVKKIRLGDPMKDDTTMGSMISSDQADKVASYIASAREQKATVLIGGERVRLAQPLEGGNFISPCILTDVRDDMRVAREEIFGPVVCVMPFETEDEVVRRANDSEFGLAGGVFTKDLLKAHRVAAALQTGNVYINNYNLYPPEMPFGGYKKSGIGRENSLLNIDAFTQVKSVFVEMGDVDSPF